MKTVLTNTELKKMIKLVSYPESMDSLFELRNNIQAYANLEMVQLTILNCCGKDYVKYLDGITGRVKDFSPREKHAFIANGFKINNEDFTDGMINIAKLSLLYIFHNYNKNNNKYKLKGD